MKDSKYLIFLNFKTLPKMSLKFPFSPFVSAMLKTLIHGFGKVLFSMRKSLIGSRIRQN